MNQQRVDPPAPPVQVVAAASQDPLRGDAFIIRQDSTWDERTQQYRNGYLACWQVPSGVNHNNVEMFLLTRPTRRLRFRAQVSNRLRNAPILLGEFGDNNAALLNAMQNHLDGMRRQNGTADANHDYIWFDLPVPADAEGPLTNPRFPRQQDPVWVNIVEPEAGERIAGMFAYSCFFGYKEDLPVVRGVRQRTVAPDPSQEVIRRMQEQHQAAMQQQNDQFQARVDHLINRFQHQHIGTTEGHRRRTQSQPTPQPQPQPQPQAQPQPKPAPPPAPTSQASVPATATPARPAVPVTATSTSSPGAGAGAGSPQHYFDAAGGPGPEDP